MQTKKRTKDKNPTGVNLKTTLFFSFPPVYQLSFARNKDAHVQTHTSREQHLHSETSITTHLLYVCESVPPVRFLLFDLMNNLNLQPLSVNSFLWRA